MGVSEQNIVNHGKDYAVPLQLNRTHISQNQFKSLGLSKALFLSSDTAAFTYHIKHN